MSSSTSSDTKKQPPIADLCNHTRWETPFTLGTLMFALYMPFGACLAVARLLFYFFIALPIYGLSQKFELEWLALKILYPLLGWIYVIKNKERATDEGRPTVFVCNHISDYDAIFLFWISKITIVVSGDYWDVLDKIAATMGTDLHFIKVYRSKGKDSFAKTRADILGHLEKEAAPPMLILPEGTTTNARTGMLQFNKFVFGLDTPILPFSLRKWDIWPINMDVLNDSFFLNFFWSLACPFNVYEVNFLEAQTIQEEETPQEFATRVQTMIADDLDLVPTDYTWRDKIEYQKQFKKTGQVDRDFVFVAPTKEVAQETEKDEAKKDK
eukprot:TRINITY_DN5785_c3_g1_i5.p1 TRINITY_DN5785_c3_g1~~TRINITY_DN5785_c3_g1_i5.p1  ORF type:complete len:326 (+),score=121.44 TRINITY_DN5785_c3_g1_i5:598-1575(+)